MRLSQVLDTEWWRNRQLGWSTASDIGGIEIYITGAARERLAQAVGSILIDHAARDCVRVGLSRLVVGEQLEQAVRNAEATGQVPVGNVAWSSTLKFIHGDTVVNYSVRLTGCSDGKYRIILAVW